MSWSQMLAALEQIAAGPRGAWCVCGHARGSHRYGRERCRYAHLCRCDQYRQSSSGQVLTLCPDCGRYAGPLHRCRR